MASWIRTLTPHDRTVWDPLWAGYLAFYEHDLPAEVTEATWARFHDPAEPMGAQGAFDDGGSLVGICHHVFHRSTWSPTTSCYLEDLFVTPEARGRGIARALVAATQQLAVDRGATQLSWQTHEGNAAARALYDQVAEHHGFVVYEVDLT